MPTAFFLTRLKPGVKAADYEKWVVQSDYPTAKKMSSIKSYKVHRINGAFGVADEIWYRDPWQTMSVCSSATKNIKMATGVTHIYLRNPAFVAQSLATIDEISNGRTVCGISIGNKVMLEQCNVDARKPMT